MLQSEKTAPIVNNSSEVAQSKRENTSDFTTFNVYVSTWKRYNELGGLSGHWVDLLDFDTVGDFFDYLNETFPDERGQHEYCFLDYEGFLPFDENYIITDEFLELIKKLSNHRDPKKIIEYADIRGIELTIDTIEEAESAFCCEAKNDYNLGYYFAHELECLKIPDNLLCYFDYKKYGREVRHDLIESENYCFFY